VADDNAGGLIRFSADGSRMAYTSLPCPATGEHGDIVVHEANGTLARRWKTPTADAGLSVGQVSLSPDGRLVKTTDPGCTLVAADFQPRSGHLAAFEGCRPGGGPAVRPGTAWCTWTRRAARCAPAPSPSSTPAATCTSRPWTSTPAAATCSTR
jgi:hypothetical protein